MQNRAISVLRETQEDPLLTLREQRVKIRCVLPGREPDRLPTPFPVLTLKKNLHFSHMVAWWVCLSPSLAWGWEEVGSGRGTGDEKHQETSGKLSLACSRLREGEGTVGTCIIWPKETNRQSIWPWVNSSRFFHWYFPIFIYLGLWFFSLPLPSQLEFIKRKAC